MHSDEANLICLPLTHGVRALLESIEKDLAEALRILGPRCLSSTDEYGRALNAGRTYVESLLARLRRVLAAADAAEPFDIGL